MSSEEVLAKCPLQQRTGTPERTAQLITWPVQPADRRWEKALFRAFPISSAVRHPRWRANDGMASCCELR